MTIRSLHLAKDLSLPLDAVTQTIAILAKRRAGKSYAMRRLVEQLFKAGQQVVIVDPKGDQWGVRSAADGKAPGLPIVILGGERGDVPLEASSGEVVAKLVVEERVSILLDLSLFRKHEVATFMTAFLENLYRLKAREIYRTPVMLVIDEADAVAPQKPQKGEERMLGAAEDIVRRGGQRGIGCVLVTQRSAVLNKNVLTQAQMLVALRTIAPQDLDALNAWIDVHGTPDQRKTLMESLPSLPVGDAWFWSPGWPTTDGIFQRVHVLPIETFDSGATPKPGEKRHEPKNLADVDLDALKGQMAATIEKAKADDPRELRRQIADLKKQAANYSKIIPTDKTREKRIEIPVLKDGQLARAEKILERIDYLADKYSTFEEDLRVTAKEIRDAILTTRQPPQHTHAQNATGSRTHPAASQGRRVAPAAATSRPTSLVSRSSRNGHRPVAEGVTKTEQRVLDSIAWWRAAGIEEPSRHQVAFVARYTVNGHFNNMVGGLRTKGLIDYPSAGGVMLTPEGAKAANPCDEIPTRDALIEKVADVLRTESLRRIFIAIVEAGQDLTREELAERTNYTVNGHFNNMVGSLRSLGVIDYPQRGGVTLGEMFGALS